MLVIGVVEESAAEQASILDGTETTRELGAILQRLELRLGVGIVVGDVRSRVGLRHAEVGQRIFAAADKILRAGATTGPTF